MGTRQISLLVNEVAIELGEFVQVFIDHVVGGMLASLEGTGGEKIRSADITIDEDKITINLNDAVVPTNPFVSNIIRNTITAMVSSLKGVKETNRIDIKIRR